jgi:hypothetical protein
VGEIEPVGRGSPAPRDGAPDRAAPGDGGPGGDAGPPGRSLPSFTGEPVEYGDWQHSPGDAWGFLSPATRRWAEEHAGAPIRDPHTGVATVYWNCWVRPGPHGPRGAAQSATYGLVMFGKRGLVASTGSTDQFVASPGATRWRNRRFAVPVDPAGVRHDHRREAGPATPTTAREDRPPGPGVGELPPGASAPVSAPAAGRAGQDDFLPPDVARMYGHLPASTQAFQCEPFVARGTRPAESNVFAAIVEDGTERRESYWAYMFDARWVTFAYARRAARVAPRRRGRRGQPAPPGGALEAAEWTVAAWAAPILRPGTAVSRR